MDFEGVRFIPIEKLGLSQLYLSAEKIAAVREWFDPRRMEIFQPLPLRDFGNHVYTLTDGHTRAYVAYKSGVSSLPVLYDRDDVVTSQDGQLLYGACIEWCQRFRLSHIKELEPRILPQRAYETLWIARCARSYSLLTQTSPAERQQLQALAPDLFLYGASEDLSTLYFESGAGDLFLYQKGFLQEEK